MSHFATTSVATVLPMKFVIARASDINRSTPKISAMPATGIFPIAPSVAANVMNPLPVTPAAPFEVRSNTPSNTSCSPSVSGVSVACATNSAAIVK